MLALGAVPERACRVAVQALAWVKYLDQVGLPWWWEVQRREKGRVALEKLHGEGVCHGWLLGVLGEGMGRVAKQYPFVYWGQGPRRVVPERQLPGLWPERRKIWLGLRRGEILRWVIAESPPLGIRMNRRHRWWLMVGETHYCLCGLSGKGIWRMEGERWEERVYGQ